MKIKLKKEQLDRLNLQELIDSDGALIDADNVRISNSREISTNTDLDQTPQTADRKSKQSHYKLAFPYYQGGSDRSMTPSTYMREGETIEETINRMVEDVLANRTPRGLIQKDDINKNNIQDFDELTTKFNRKDVANDLKNLIDTINRQDLSGEELAIIINHLIISLDTKKIDNNILNNIKNNL